MWTSIAARCTQWNRREDAQRFGQPRAARGLSEDANGASDIDPGYTQTCVPTVPMHTAREDSRPDVSICGRRRMLFVRWFLYQNPVGWGPGDSHVAARRGILVTVILHKSASNPHRPALPSILCACVPAAMLVGAVSWRPVGPESPYRVSPGVEVGNAACRSCHTAIYDSYSRTAMARTSGPATADLEGSFKHARSGVSYRVFRDGPTVVLAYQRDGPRALYGKQILKYYVGSNTRGRAFLFDIDDFLYQTPINYYAATNTWDMSPGYAQLREMELNHPVDSTCLFCHASRVQAPKQGTLNRFGAVPFLQDGVSCERCHGPGSNHVNRSASMVNPAKLTGERRDSICMQCHLEGEARIARAGRSQGEYRPGEILSDYVAVFVREDDAAQRRGAVSHVESLALSRCKRASGEALSCITCHDPHVQPGALERSDYYRSKCVSCHASIAERHYARQQDCTACHMPRLDSADISHTIVTDHRIPRTPRPDRPLTVDIRKLVQFGNAKPDARDLGLAYGQVALRGNVFAARESFRLLEQAQQEHPNDPEVLTRLGFLYQTRGDSNVALKYYERAFTQDPDRAVVANNLAVFYARRGMLTRSLELWRNTFDNNPHLSEIGVNLASGLCALGNTDAASAVLQRVLKHNPDFGTASQALADLGRRGCRSNRMP
jgi:tetratricopeptide repeat protein/cytochrome c554/c'-like protein